MWLCPIRDPRSPPANNNAFFLNLFEVDLVSMSLRLVSEGERREACLATAAVANTSDKKMGLILAT